MKSSISVVVALALSSSVKGRMADGGDRTITRVVKLLQDMLTKSKADGDEMRSLYAKFKCYCDTNEAEKKASIEKLGTGISQLGSQIEGLQAQSGVLSKEVQKLDKDIAATQQSMDEASALRTKEEEEFQAMKADSESAIDQLAQAIDALSDVAADQTKSVGADHEKQMADFNEKGTGLVGLRKVVQQALVSASAFTSKKQMAIVESFLQTPFTGTYSSQSAQVMGIIKNMRDTFQANLDSAVIVEEKAKKAFDEFTSTKQAALADMQDSYARKQTKLGGNDDLIASGKKQKSISEGQKLADEEFLASLLSDCSTKAKQYDQRTLLRRQEEAALSEAIAILNSDAAFATFGKVDATSTGTALLQRISVHHPGRARDLPREKAKRFLRKVSEGHWSPVLSKVVGLLEKGNPFSIVLEEITKMLALIKKEEEADQEKLSWCNNERTTNEKSLDEKKAQIVSLTTEIDELNNLIDGADTGLKAQIQETETSLKENTEAQTFETKERKEANVLYQKDIAHLVEANTLLESAISVLKKYYSKLEKEAFVQRGPALDNLKSRVKGTSTNEPVPETWEGSYKGQGEQGGDAIEQLESILTGTKSEEAAAHTEENDAQIAYEASMTQLKEEEAAASANLARLQKELADKEVELTQKNADLKSTVADKEAIETYLQKIKPGCDFITNEIETRTANRNAETEALEEATTLLKGTPVYQTAMAAAHDESLGDCLDICKLDEEHAKCKACLAKTSVPGYCAGHPGTSGCSA